MIDVRLEPDLRATIARLVEDTATRVHSPATVVALVAGGSVIELCGTGALDDGAPPDANSLFRIASMTKSFTAAAVLRLRDDGALGLDDPVASHVPQLATLRPPTADSAPITVRHLLTMSSGLATDDAWADRHLHDTPAEMDAWFAAGATFARSPGLAMDYSNFGYAMLGRVIEAVTGQPATEAIRTGVLAPLGLESTVWMPSDAPGGTRVAGPFRERDGAAEPDDAPQGTGGFSPMGGLWSTASDLARWIGFMCDAFPPRDDPDPGPIRRSTRREQQQLHTPYGSPMTWHHIHGELRQVGIGYGMGLQLAHHVAAGPVVAHSGGLPGYGSNMRWLPHRGIGIVALANVTYAPMANLTHEILQLLVDADVLPAAPLPDARLVTPAATALVELLNDWDDGRAERLFADNVELDEPWHRRRTEAEAQRRGGRWSIVEVRPLTEAEADVELELGSAPDTDQDTSPNGDRPARRWTLEMQLAPTVPPLVQWYELKPSATDPPGTR